MGRVPLATALSRQYRYASKRVVWRRGTRLHIDAVPFGQRPLEHALALAIQSHRQRHPKPYLAVERCLLIVSNDSATSPLDSARERRTLHPLLPLIFPYQNHTLASSSTTLSVPGSFLCPRHALWSDDGPMPASRPLPRSRPRTPSTRPTCRPAGAKHRSTSSA